MSLNWFISSLGEIVGKLSVKHIYEIAKVKNRDKALQGVPLKVSTVNILRYFVIFVLGSLSNDFEERKGFGN